MEDTWATGRSTPSGPSLALVPPDLRSDGTLGLVHLHALLGAQGPLAAARVPGEGLPQPRPHPSGDGGGRARAGPALRILRLRAEQPTVDECPWREQIRTRTCRCRFANRSQHRRAMVDFELRLSSSQSRKYLLAQNGEDSPKRLDSYSGASLSSRLHHSDLRQQMKSILSVGNIPRH